MRGVDTIDAAGQALAEQTNKSLCRDRPRVEIGYMAEEAHDKFVNWFFPERPDKAAERMRKLLIGPRAAKLFGRDAGKVDCGFGCAGSEEIGDILRDLDTDRLLRFLGGGAE